MLQVHASGSVLHHDAHVIGTQAAHSTQNKQAEDGEDEGCGGERNRLREVARFMNRDKDEVCDG